MPKQRRNKPSAAAIAAPRSIVERAKAMCETLMLSVEKKAAAGDVNSTTLREATGVARAVATLDAEQRAQARADERAARDLSRDRVSAYLRQLSNAEWSHLCREINKARDGSSVLA